MRHELCSGNHHLTQCEDPAIPVHAHSFALSDSDIKAYAFSRGTAKEYEVELVMETIVFMARNRSFWQVYLNGFAVM